MWRLYARIKCLLGGHEVICESYTIRKEGEIIEVGSKEYCCICQRKW